MRRLALTLMIAVFAAGCARYGEPLRHFPQRNNDSRRGIVRNWSTVAALNLYVRDEAGRVVEEWYLGRATGPISSHDIDRSVTPVTVERILPPGCYTVEVIPFRYGWTVLEGRERFDFLRRSRSVCVGRDPLAAHDWRKGVYWGWILDLP